ncbi:hypothetical protein PIB30_100625, partial [Stylosanthes scabra]|nr:hypothetical protein [Stylosanthes scabra]
LHLRPTEPENQRRRSPPSWRLSLSPSLRLSFAFGLPLPSVRLVGDMTESERKRAK